MATKTNGFACVGALLILMFIVGWTIFGYVTLFAAYAELPVGSGTRSALGIYLIGSIIMLVVYIVSKIISAAVK